MTSSLVHCNYFVYCFGGQSPSFDQLFYFRGIKLKFGRGVNSETLIVYFISILPYKLNLGVYDKKIKGFMSFLTEFI